MLLETKRLSKQFGGLKALDSVDLCIPSGYIYGLIGPNGAGKTTLFNLITGVITPTSGHIYFAGESLVGLSPHKIAKKGISRTYQNLKLFPSLTVRDHLKVAILGQRQGLAHITALLTNKLSAAEINKLEELLDFLDLTAKGDYLAKSLAYGESRRLEIARALAGNPKLLVLDEPAAGMNEAESLQLMEYIRQMAAWGITVLLIEHDMKLVMEVCQEIAVLNFGTKLTHGFPAAVQNNPQVISAYLGGD